MFLPDGARLQLLLDCCSTVISSVLNRRNTLTAFRQLVVVMTRTVLRLTRVPS